MLGLSHVFGKEIVVGVDIGSRLIKVVRAEATGGRYLISHALVTETPVDAVREGIVVGVEAVAQAIKEALQVGGIDANAAVAAISGSSVIVRHVKVPKISEAVLRKSIRFEAARYISSSLDDSIVEFEIGGAIADEPDKMAVMIVAAPNDMITSRLAALQAAGLEPISVDIEAFAIQRALIDVNPHPEDVGQTIAILNIGAATSDISIIASGHFAITRNIPIAGDHFSQALRATAKSQDWSEIERIKRSTNMGALLNPESAPEAALQARALQPAMDELLREVRRSMNYYQSQLQEPSSSNLPAHINQQSNAGSVSRILITGGSSQMPGIEQYMSARLGVPVSIATILGNSVYDVAPSFQQKAEQNQQCLPLAIGLALKELPIKQTVRSGAVRPAVLGAKAA